VGPPGGLKSGDNKSAKGLGGAAGGGGSPNLESASAADLKSAIKEQEAEIARQKKEIEDLQAQLKAKG